MNRRELKKHLKAQNAAKKIEEASDDSKAEGNEC